jgi:octaprenyl-diphosphate synthase
MTATAFKVLTNGRINPDLLDKISAEVALVEDELRQLVASDVRMVERVGRTTLEAGGKRLRPAFVALAAKATGLPFDEERTRKLGACMEMIHMATLVHDDVIDNSPTRRGRPTASAEVGNTAAILSGDVLMAKAMILLARDGDLPIIRAVSEAVVDMAEGEVRELEVRGDFELDETTHLTVLRMKTASFIEACCEIGAMVAGADATVRQALRDYGYHVGMAFQIVDDLLDYRGDKAKTGKTLGTDFRDGQATLPLIFLREHLSDAESKIARRRFGNGANDDEIRMIADWMDTRGAFSRSEEYAREHIEKALDALEGLPDSNTRELLETVAEYVIQRQG